MRIPCSCPPSSCEATRAATSAASMYGPITIIVSASTGGALTANCGWRPFSTSSTCATVSTAARFCASTVEAARCGVTTMRSDVVRMFPIAGSSLNTSMAAPPRRPSVTASYSACSSTSAPRAVLMR